MQALKLGSRGEALIKSFEQLRLTAYRNFPNEPWTAGWGHTGKDVTENTTCTPEHAEIWFECDVAAAEQAVNMMVDVDLNQNEFDALVSFGYNVGVSAETHSTLIAFVNRNALRSAAEQFLKWDHVGGIVVPGLTKRRIAERDLFLEAV